MAYNPDQTPYPSSFDYPDPRLYQNPAPYQQQPPSRSRASSVARPDGPVSDAVSNAFHNSDAASHVDPAVIAQITEEVRRQVIESLSRPGGLYEGRNHASPLDPSGFSKPPAPQNPSPQAYVPRSSTDSTSASYPPRDVYTPPSPQRHDHPDRSTPSPPLSQGSASYPSREELERRYSAREPSPPAANTSRVRPATAPRAATDEWLSPPATALEKAYGRLFDEYDQPTPRLGQLLRGLAVHIIEHYEPRDSLVITPAKMQKFYQDVRLDDDIYPWNRIFGSLPNSAISKMYRDLKCQHHFVQDQYSETPHLPALTPLGFQSWMTIMIQAHPDIEYRRIAEAVLHMPISNADDRGERFPKELSRRLFPAQENLQARQRCAAALCADGKIPVPRTTSFPPPPPTQPPPQTETQTTGSFERERQPYCSHADTARTDSRERKPYVAKEGGGKVHEDPASSGSGLRPEQAPRPHRSNSISQGSGARDNPPWPSDYTQSVPPPSSRHYRTQSHLNAGRRARSPPGSGFARSDGNISDIPASEFFSNLYSDRVDEDNRKFAKDAEMKRNEWARRHAEEDAAARGPYMGRSAYEEDYYRSRGMSTGNVYGGVYGGYIPPPPPRY